MKVSVSEWCLIKFRRFLYHMFVFPENWVCFSNGWVSILKFQSLYAFCLAKNYICICKKNFYKEFETQNFQKKSRLMYETKNLNICAAKSAPGCKIHHFLFDARTGVNFFILNLKRSVLLHFFQVWNARGELSLIETFFLFSEIKIWLKNVQKGCHYFKTR